MEEHPSFHVEIDSSRSNHEYMSKGAKATVPRTKEAGYIVHKNGLIKHFEEGQKNQRPKFIFICLFCLYINLAHKAPHACNQNTPPIFCRGDRRINFTIISIAIPVSHLHTRFNFLFIRLILGAAFSRSPLGYLELF